MSTKPDITQTLLGLTAGDHRQAEEMLPLVYAELHELAARHLRHERRNHTLQATALVNEAYIRLVDQSRVDWKNKAHFRALAAEMIRRILVDYARKKATAKRGGGAVQVTIALEDAVAAPAGANEVDLIALDDALRELSELSERQARVVELRFFGGLAVEETAFALQVSQRTIKGDWRVAKAWLRKKLSE